MNPSQRGTEAPKKSRINPLSRIPKQPRLVIAVRGGAGVGKSHFVRTLSDAGLGRLCIFDVERKSRLLPGVGDRFDGLEIEAPDELPEFIDWALHGEGQAQNYGCFALDSWAAYFGAKHSAMLEAVRERTGDPLAQPSAEELASDQIVLQGVLRKLCMESGKSVVIIDQIPAKGKETKEDNEIGRVLPMTASGLEYFVDVMVELSLQERAGQIVRVFQVVKSNSPAFSVGDEFVGDEITFKDFLQKISATGTSPDGTQAPTRKHEPEFLPEGETVATTARLTTEQLIAKAEGFGFRHSELVTAARVYHGQTNLYRLTPDQIDDLDRRMSAKAASHPTSPEGLTTVPTPAPTAVIRPKSAAGSKS